MNICLSLVNKGVEGGGRMLLIHIRSKTKFFKYKKCTFTHFLKAFNSRVWERAVKGAEGVR